MLYFILLEYIFFILEDSCTSIRAYSRLYYIDIIFVQAFIFKKLLYSIHVFFFCSCNFASSPTTPNKNQPTSGASASQRSGRGTLRYLRALLGWRSPRSQQKHRKKWGRYGVMSFFVDLMFFFCVPGFLGKNTVNMILRVKSWILLALLVFPPKKWTNVL